MGDCWVLGTAVEGFVCMIYRLKEHFQAIEMLCTYISVVHCGRWDTGVGMSIEERHEICSQGRFVLG